MERMGHYSSGLTKLDTIRTTECRHVLLSMSWECQYQKSNVRFCFIGIWWILPPAEEFGASHAEPVRLDKRIQRPGEFIELFVRERIGDCVFVRLRDRYNARMNAGRRSKLCHSRTVSPSAAYQHILAGSAVHPSCSGGLPGGYERMGWGSTQKGI